MLKKSKHMNMVPMLGTVVSSIWHLSSRMASVHTKSVCSREAH
jgi:hypothetical protein